VARSCVFCRAPVSSKEHAFPDWLSKVVPGEGPMINTRDGGAKSWRAGGFDHQVRQVCGGCNHGWMSDLEGGSKALVTELILDRRTAPLSTTEQIKLSTWLYKTGIMIALAYPEESRFVLADDYRFFYEHRKPPDGTSVWISALAFEPGEQIQVGWGKPERLDFSRAADGTAIEPHGYRLSFSVVTLVCQIMRDPHQGKFDRPREFRDVWTRIRPISKGIWPPGRRLAAAGLEDVAGGRIFSGRP
jgi:hypothetical protein